MLKEVSLKDDKIKALIELSNICCQIFEGVTINELVFKGFASKEAIDPNSDKGKMDLAKLAFGFCISGYLSEFEQKLNWLKEEHDLIVKQLEKLNEDQIKTLQMVDVLCQDGSDK